MARLLAYLQRKFGARAIDPNDELMGAIDLSDCAYCSELLARHSPH